MCRSIDVLSGTQNYVDLVAHYTSTRSLTAYHQGDEQNSYCKHPGTLYVATTRAALHDNNEASAKVTTQYGRR